MRPNILCVVFDTARADALGPYGAPAGSTPAAAQLADSGSALPAVYATASWTLPSHGSMFTGLMPRACRIGETGVDRSESAANLRALRDRVLPELLRRSGYATGAVSANVWVSEWTGFDTGFDEFVLLDSGRQGRIHSRDLRSRARWAQEAMRATVDDGAAEAERVLASWIERRERGRPFFWFVNLVECHSPYLPPRPYNDLGPIGRLRAGIEAQRHLILDAIWRACVGEFDVPAGALGRMRHLYRRSIRYMDDWLARVLERLDSRGILEDTAVILTSDHGENFGEGGLLAHAFSLDNRLIRVPLIAAGPGTDALPQGVTSLGELPALIARIAGLPDHPWRREDVGPPGVALAQLNPPSARDHPKVGWVRAEWNLDEAGVARLTTPFACATDGRLKVIRREGRDEVLDLDRDPLEVAPTPVDGLADGSRTADQVTRLRAALDHPAARRAVDAPEPAREEGPVARSAQETEEIEERMRLLGYM